MPPTSRLQCRAATAGSIISPTPISVPSAWKAANRFSTTSARNTMCQAPPRAPTAWAKLGSKHSSTSGRQAKASTARLSVAVAAISSSAASSTPSALPNSNWVNSAVPPPMETSATPSASAHRYSAASAASSRPPVARESAPAPNATTSPASKPPTAMAGTESPAIRKAPAMPGRMPCPSTSAVRLIRRSIRNTPSGGAATLTARQPTSARRMKP